MSHGDKQERRELLKEANSQEWRIIESGGYVKIYCPCPEKHKKTVRLTPSNPNYWKELRRHLKRMTCWKEEA